MTLRWTREPPTMSGWYWFRIPPWQSVVEVVVVGGRAVARLRSGSHELERDARVQWAGPIPEPEEP